MEIVHLNSTGHFIAFVEEREAEEKMACRKEEGEKDDSTQLCTNQQRCPTIPISQSTVAGRIFSAATRGYVKRVLLYRTKLKGLV